MIMRPNSMSGSTAPSDLIRIAANLAEKSLRGRQIVSSIAADRSKWNSRWQDSKGDSFPPKPHELGALWGHRFAGGPMLDAAAGLGRGIATAGPAFHPVFAVDISDVAVFRARNYWRDDSRIRWIVADVHSILWPHGFFGLVCAFGFTHLPFFARLPHLIAPGGMFLYEGFSKRQITVKPSLNPEWTATGEQMREIFPGWEILTCEESASQPFLLRFTAIRPTF
ncbi:MAG: class I SAM-dependent methyltransferase [SAR324 cluster bacterium]|nr:class I SAM-dependent methyltransferase [SAR324 cluster bacterium]